MAITSTFLGSSTQSGLASTTVTFSSVTFGTATSDRIIVVGLNYLLGSGDGIVPTMTIGGITATKLVSREGTTDTNAGVAIYAAAVPTGTSGNIVATKTGVAFNRAGIGWWGTVDANITAFDTDSTQGTSGTESVAIDIAAGGFVAGSAFNQGSGGVNSATWTGVTERFDQTIVGFSNQTGGSSDFASSSTGTTIQAAWTGSTEQAVFCVVSLQPTTPATSIKTVDGLAKASVKTVDGLAIASVKTINGLA